jgi:hypothetical protein
MRKTFFKHFEDIRNKVSYFRNKNLFYLNNLSVKTNTKPNSIIMEGERKMLIIRDLFYIYKKGAITSVAKSSNIFVNKNTNLNDIIKGKVYEGFIKFKYRFFTYICILILMIYFQFNKSYAQGTAGDNAKYQTIRNIDMPTAGLFPVNDYAITVGYLTDGGLSAQFFSSFYKFFNAGISFSGRKIIGAGDIELQKIPGFDFRFRIISESLTIPAIALGFSNQGTGNYIINLDRFETFSTGFYLSTSKNFKWKLGAVALHTCLNYSIDPEPENRTVNFYVGIEQSLGKIISMNFEYNFTNDDSQNVILNSKGMFNSALRCSISDGVTLEFQFRDLFNHQKYSNGIKRQLFLEIIKSF